MGVASWGASILEGSAKGRGGSVSTLSSCPLGDTGKLVPRSNHHWRPMGKPLQCPATRNTCRRGQGSAGITHKYSFLGNFPLPALLGYHNGRLRICMKERGFLPNQQ